MFHPTILEQTMNEQIIVDFPIAAIEYKDIRVKSRGPNLVPFLWLALVLV